MKQLIKLELMSNLLRPFNKKYQYNDVFKMAWESKLPLLLSILLLNLLLISASITIDCIDLCLNLSFWSAFALRIIPVSIAIFEFSFGENSIIKAIDITILIASLFVPIWSVFLLINLVFRTFITTIFMQ